MENEQRIISLLEKALQSLAEIKEAFSQCPKRKLPFPAGFNAAGRKRCLSQRLRGGLLDPEIRVTIMQLRKDGKRFEDIAAFIREHWPEQPEKHVSKSTIHRFFQAARNGRLREFGIEPPVEG